MDKPRSPQSNRRHLRVLEGGLSTPEGKADSEALTLQRFDFLRRLEQAGMNTELCKRLLCVTPGQSFEEAIAFLEARVREAKGDLDASTIEIFEHNAALIRHIFETHTVCIELARAAEAQPDAIALKKRTQLKICDDEQITTEEKGVLLALLDQDTPQLEGLDLNNPQNIKDFRTLLDEPDLPDITA